MRIRTFVSSVALATALVSSSALLSQALAQKGGIMAPSTSWSVSKVNNQAGPYCTMAMQFNRDTVLTIARNEQLETSFALDFQRPVFQPSTQMSVILDPGAGQQRAFDIQPVSGKAFVTRMGRDDTFFQALDRTGLLRVEVNGRSYHFNMADIGSGQSKLDACIASMVMPAAGDEPLLPGPESGTVVAQTDNQSYRQEINALRRQIAELKTQNQAIETQMNTRSESKTEVESSVAQLSGKLRALEDQNALLKKQLEEAKSAQMAAVSTDNQDADLEELRAENLRLKAEVQTLAPQDNSDALAELEQQINELQSDNEKLQVALNEKSKGDALSGSLKGEIELLESRNANLTAQIENMRADIEGEYKGKLASLENENQTLKATMDKKGVDAGLLEQLKQQIAEAQNENRLLKETAAQAQEVLKEEISQENAALMAGLEEEKAKQAERIAELERDIQALEAGNPEIETAQTNQAEMDALKEYNESLKQQVASMEGQRGQAETLLKRIAMLESENEELKNSAELVQLDSEADAADSGALIALQEENAALKAEVEDAEANKQKAEELALALEELKTANTELQALVSDDSVQHELAAALEKNSELRAQLADKDLQLVELTALREELTGLKEASTNAQDEKRAFEAQSAKSSEKLAALETELEALKQESAKTLEEKADLEAQIKENAEKIAGFEAERDKLKGALADVVVVADKLKKDNALKDEELQRLRLAALEPKPEAPVDAGAIKEKQLRITALEAEVEALASENEQLKQQKQDAAPIAPKVAKAQPVKSEPKPAPQPVAAAEPTPAPAPEKKPDVQVAKAEPAAGSVDKGNLQDMRATLVSLEDNIRKLEMAGRKDEAQMLSRQYVALKSELERHEYSEAGQSPAPVEQVAENNVPALVEEQVYEDLSHLNEAQMQERAVKQQREAFGAERVAVVGEQPAPQAPKAKEEPVEEIVMNQSADPFEDMAVDGREVVPLQKIEKGKPEEVVPLEIIAQKEAPEAQPEPQATPVQEGYAGAFSIKELVTRANVSTPDKVKKVGKASGEQIAAYQWNGGAIYGSAEQKPITSSADFDGFVQEYLERTQMRCPGEFAIVPDNTLDQGGLRADSYEVACVGTDVSSGASLLFFNQGGTFTVVAHEAPTEEFATAMDYRNQILKVITGS